MLRFTLVHPFEICKSRPADEPVAAASANYLIMSGKVCRTVARRVLF
jgi:hypothetical protein